MSRSRRIRGLALRVTWLSLAGMLAAVPLAAQSTPADGLDRRMGEFLRTLRGYASAEEVAAFFPRRGDVTWVLRRNRPLGTSVGRWRFAPADLPRAIAGEPLCETFSYGGDVAIAASLMSRITGDKRMWRRVTGNRFVPPGAPARSATFVEWGREDGRWVIEAFGEERWPGPRVLGGWGYPNSVVRDSVRGDLFTLPMPADALYAAGARWFEDHETIRVDDEGLAKYGRPRALPEGSVRRIGTLHGVAVYMERGADFPEVVYVPVSPEGLFAPYQHTTGNGCH